MRHLARLRAPPRRAFVPSPVRHLFGLPCSQAASSTEKRQHHRSCSLRTCDPFRVASASSACTGKAHRKCAQERCACLSPCVPKSAATTATATTRTRPVSGLVFIQARRRARAPDNAHSRASDDIAEPELKRRRTRSSRRVALALPKMKSAVANSSVQISMHRAGSRRRSARRGGLRRTLSSCFARSDRGTAAAPSALDSVEIDASQAARLLKTLGTAVESILAACEREQRTLQTVRCCGKPGISHLCITRSPPLSDAISLAVIDRDAVRACSETVARARRTPRLQAHKH